MGAPRGLIGYPRYNLLLEEGGKQEEKRVAPVWRKEGRDEEQGREGSGGAVYYGPDSCRWVLRAPPGYTLNLTVLHLDTRPQDPVKVSWVGGELGRAWNLFSFSFLFLFHPVRQRSGKNEEKQKKP